jgi:hypothetical protein
VGQLVPVHAFLKIELLLARYHESAKQIDVGVAYILIGDGRCWRLGHHGAYRVQDRRRCKPGFFHGFLLFAIASSRVPPTSMADSARNPGQSPSKEKPAWDRVRRRQELNPHLACKEIFSGTWMHVYRGDPESRQGKPR